MGQCSDRISDKTEVAIHNVSINRSKRLSHNPALTAARYHLSIQGGRRLGDDYEVSSKVLGRGLCGQVVLAHGRVDHRNYALKTIRKKNVSRAKMQQLTEEVEIHLALDHPHVARLHNVYESEEEISLLSEFCEGGELYFSLQSRGTYPDGDAAEATRQMLRAVSYLHSHNIVHRDLKLENFLYESGEGKHLKLIDFGFAKVWDPSIKMTASCGSIAYVSPDVLLRKGYTNKCDIWSLGVIAWMLLAGYPPFHGGEKVMMESIKAGAPDWSHQSRWKPVSEDAIDLVRRLLSPDPQRRPSAAEALQHRWLARPRGVAEATPLTWQTMGSLADYAMSSQVRRAFLQLLALEVPSSDLAELRQAFLDLDRSNSGAVSLRDLKDAICDSDLGKQGAGKAAMALRHADPAALSELFAALDAHGTGQVYFSDFLAATLQPHLREQDGALRAAFARLDCDGSGLIHACDLAGPLGGLEDAPQVFAEELQAASGSLDFDAFVALVQASGEAHSPEATPTASTATPSGSPLASARSSPLLPPVAPPSEEAAAAGCESSPQVRGPAIAESAALEAEPDIPDSPPAAGLRVELPGLALSEPLVEETFPAPPAFPAPPPAPVVTPVPFSKFADLALPFKPEDLHPLDAAAHGPGKFAKGVAEKAYWRSPQSPLGGS